MLADVDLVVVGAGIVGTSIAHQVKTKLPSWRVLLIDKEVEPGRHQTSRNSGVIHSGIYYRPGSFKARFCKSGYQGLLEFCERHDIPFRLTGKLIVANDDREISQLSALMKRGYENGLEDLRLLTSEEVKEFEPYCRAKKAIYVPQTGIISFPAVQKKYLELFQEAGGKVIFGDGVEGFRKTSAGTVVVTSQRSVTTKLVVTAAGLHSDRIAKKESGKDDLRIVPFRGE